MKKYLLLIVIQFVFFTLIFFRNWFLKESPTLNNVLYIGLFVGLSYFIFKTFYNCANSVKLYFVNLTSLFVLFELMKYITFKSGATPKYIENPLISAVLSFIAINIYLGIIMSSIYVLKKYKK